MPASRSSLAAPPALTGRAEPAGEKLIGLALLACGLLSIATTVGVIAVLVVETAAFFREVGLGAFLFDTQWSPLFADPHFGIWPLVTGTALITGISIAVALPFGLLAAVFLSEIASPRLRSVLKPALEVLAGVPTIVYGYFALVIVTPALQAVVPGLAGFNALGPGIVMGIMIMPMISSLGEDALAAVPDSLREAAYALGATRVSAIARVVVPTAFSGIAAAVVLSVSRAIGETMVVAIAAGQQPRLTLDPRVPIETMTAFIVQVSMGDTPSGTLAYRTLYVVGATLFVITLGVNIVSQRLAARLRRA